MDAVMRALNAGVNFCYFRGSRGYFRVHRGQLSKDADKMSTDFDLALSGLRVGRRSWRAWAHFRLAGLGAVFVRIRKLGFRRTRAIYETEQ
jgi:hypothetical protein